MRTRGHDPRQCPQHHHRGTNRNRIVRAAPDAVILVVTDPPYPLVDIARIGAGHGRVLKR
jgi:hypothetical protein